MIESHCVHFILIFASLRLLLQHQVILYITLLRKGLIVAESGREVFETQIAARIIQMRKQLIASI